MPDAPTPIWGPLVSFLSSHKAALPQERATTKGQSGPLLSTLEIVLLVHAEECLAEMGCLVQSWDRPTVERNNLEFTVTLCYEVWVRLPWGEKAGLELKITTPPPFLLHRDFAWLEEDVECQLLDQLSSLEDSRFAQQRQHAIQQAHDRIEALLFVTE